MGCHGLLPRVFPTQGSNLGLLHSKEATESRLSHWEELEGDSFQVWVSLFALGDRLLREVSNNAVSQLKKKNKTNLKAFNYSFLYFHVLGAE